MKVNRPEDGKWKTLRQIVKIMWSRDEIDGFIKRLNTLKEAINTRVLFVFLEILKLQSTSLPATLDGLVDQQSKRILSSVAEYTQHAHQELSQNLAKAMSQLASRLENRDCDEHHRRRRVILDEMRHTSANEVISDTSLGITSEIEMLSVSRGDEAHVRTAVRIKILESLRYQSMSSRCDSIINAHPETFQWAYQASTPNQLHWDNLAEWLRSGTGVYWMNGKPGSGKSTLMKHIADSDATRRYLHKWAFDGGGSGPSYKLCIANFFFWNSGTDEQKSKAGMLRSILFSVLEEWPDLIPVVFPERWAQYYSQELDLTISPWSKTWSTERLEAAFKCLLNQKKLPLKLFLLIDGLDECDDDHEDLASLLAGIVDREHSLVKACVSSRRLSVFKGHFGVCPQLQLQHLTFDDIRQYVHDTFRINGAFQNLYQRDSAAAYALINDVVERADGVFLWVRIVVKDLLQGVRNLDNISELWQRLQALPRDLELLYDYLIRRIGPVYLPWVSKVFQINRSFREIKDKSRPKAAQRQYGPFERGGTEIDSLTLMELHVAISEGLDPETIYSMSQQALLRKCQETEIRIAARCGFLLEIPITAANKVISPESSVQYLHRTVRDFLEEGARWRAIVEYAKDSTFDPYVCLMRSSTFILHRTVHFGGTMELKHATLDLEASKAMTFASYADAHSQSHRVQTSILDDINGVMTQHSANGQAWYDSMEHLTRQRGFIRSFEDFALFLDLSGYISIKTSQRGLGIQEKATSLLYRRVKEDFRRWFGITTDTSLDMASALLRLGADMQWKDNQGIGIWDIYLGVICRNERENRLLSEDKVATGKVREIFLQSLQIMARFLSAGAKIRVALSYDGSKLSLDEFIRVHLVRRYSTEAAEVVSEYEKAILREKRKREWNEICQHEEEVGGVNKRHCI